MADRPYPASSSPFVSIEIHPSIDLSRSFPAEGSPSSLVFVSSFSVPAPTNVYTFRIVVCLSLSLSRNLSRPVTGFSPFLSFLLVLACHVERAHSRRHSVYVPIPTHTTRDVDKGEYRRRVLGRRGCEFLRSFRKRGNFREAMPMLFSNETIRKKKRYLIGFPSREAPLLFPLPHRPPHRLVSREMPLHRRTDRSRKSYKYTRIARGVNKLDLSGILLSAYSRRATLRLCVATTSFEFDAS